MVNLVRDIELWRYVQGFEGMYEVSSWGRVRSLDRVESARGFPRIRKGRFLRPKKDRYGYMVVSLCKKSCMYHKLIHRLVGAAFIENPLNKPQINHTEGDKTDNRFWMLEWVTGIENIQHAHKSGLKNCDHLIALSRTKVRGLNANSKKVTQMYLNGDTVKVWDCVLDASISLHICKAGISECATGKQKTSGGYLWSYEVKNNN